MYSRVKSQDFALTVYIRFLKIKELRIIYLESSSKTCPKIHVEMSTGLEINIIRILDYFAIFFLPRD